MIFPLWDSGGQICTGILFRAIDSLSYPASMPPTIGRLILLHNPCAWYQNPFLFARWDLKFWDRMIPISVFNWRIKVNFPFFNWLTLHRFSWGLLPKAITGTRTLSSWTRAVTFWVVSQVLWIMQHTGNLGDVKTCDCLSEMALWAWASDNSCKFRRFF